RMRNHKEIGARRHAREDVGTAFVRRGSGYPGRHRTWGALAGDPAIEGQARTGRLGEAAGLGLNAHRDGFIQALALLRRPDCGHAGPSSVAPTCATWT